MKKVLLLFVLIFTLISCSSDDNDAVETPVNLTTRQKELLQEFDEIQAENNPNSSNFFKSVKSFWDSMKG